MSEKLIARDVAFRWLYDATWQRGSGKWELKVEKKERAPAVVFTHCLHPNKNMINSMCLWAAKWWEMWSDALHRLFRRITIPLKCWCRNVNAGNGINTKYWNTHTQIDNDFSMLSTRFVLIIHVAQTHRIRVQYWRRRAPRAGSTFPSWCQIAETNTIFNLNFPLSLPSFATVFPTLVWFCLHCLISLESSHRTIPRRERSNEKNESKKHTDHERQQLLVVFLSIFHKFYLVACRRRLSSFFLVSIPISQSQSTLVHSVLTWRYRVWQSRAKETQ